MISSIRGRVLAEELPSASILSVVSAASICTATVPSATANLSSSGGGGGTGSSSMEFRSLSELLRQQQQFKPWRSVSVKLLRRRAMMERLLIVEGPKLS